MRLGRPRTLLGLVLTGLALVSMPLLFGIGNAAIQLGQLADESGAVVSESADVELENQRLDRLLGDLERRARQYLVTTDDALLALYSADYASIRQSLTALETLPQTGEITAAIARVRESLLAVDAAVTSGSTDDAVDNDVRDNFAIINASARAAAEGMRALTNQRLTALQADTQNAQRVLAWQSAALIPGTIVLVLFFLLLIGRPMRQVDRAIRELGKGDFSHTIQVTGPTDIETLGRQLEWLRHRLKESADEKNKFLRHMSHELKTPLANIREGTELLLDGSVGHLEQQQQEVTGILRDNGLKLQKLIENLLTFSAWQTKTASLELSEFELKPLVFSALSQHRLVISNRKIKLHLNVSPIKVFADEGKIRLVLENLLSNAIKFTPDGGTIHVGAEMQGPNLIVEVADSGPGIAAEDGARIFEAFYQGRRLQGGHVGGTGIGLSVVLECVQAHGGTVRLMDTGEWPGAHFKVELPLRRRESDRPALVVNG